MFLESIYEVATTTGDMAGAGTDANVFIRMIGSHGDTGNMQLGNKDSPYDEFQTGATDLFKLDACDVGQV